MHTLLNVEIVKWKQEGIDSSVFNKRLHVQFSEQ